jgi:hypothetical protein
MTGSAVLRVCWFFCAWVLTLLWDTPRYAATGLGMVLPGSYLYIAFYTPHHTRLVNIWFVGLFCWV